MNSKSIKTWIGISYLSTVLLTSCKPTIESSEPTKGDLNPAVYVALGSNSSAGFADGAMYQEAQLTNYTAILAKQLELIGGGNFNAPYTNSEIGNNAAGKSRTYLGYRTDCLGVTSLSPLPLASSGDLSIFQQDLYASSGPFRNMSVPDAKTIDLFKPNYGDPAAGAGNYNPYFARMKSQANTDIIGDVLGQNHTFFTINIGERDALEYALSGGTSSLPTPIQGTLGVGFETSLEIAIQAMTANQATGAIATIPDVTQFPFFNTIPYDGLTLDQASADQLNGIYNPIGIFFQVGKNAFVIQDPAAGQFQVRQMVPGECVLLSIPLDSVKCNKMGSIVPIPNRHVLTLEEKEIVQNAISSYNSVIRSKADLYKLALVDLHTYYAKIKSGFSVNGVGVSSTFVSGNAFSLDGLHLNPIGNALIANEFIKAINQKYKSTIPQVDATKYRGVIFP